MIQTISANAMPGKIASLEQELVNLRASAAERKKKIDEFRSVLPVAFFEPNPWQYRAIKDMAENFRPNVQNVFGHFPGNGVGKTWLVPALIWNIACGPQNEFFNYSLFKNWPFPKHIRCIGDKQLFMEGSGEFWKACNAVFPKPSAVKWESEKGDYSYPSRYYLPNDFILDCVTPEIKLRAHEGVELGMLIILEPVEEEIWDMYPRAFRHGGIKLLSCTLAHCSEWIDRRVMEEPMAIITKGTAMDNCEDTVVQTEHGDVRGKLSKASLMSMFDSYSEQDRQARWDGTPLYWRGRILQRIWNDHVHIVDDDQCPGIVMHKINIDPHPGKPYCFVIGGFDARGNPWIIDEWPRFDDFGKLYHEVAYDTPNHGEIFYFDKILELRGRYSPNINILDFKISNTPSRLTDGTSCLRERMEQYCHCQFESQNSDVTGDGGGIALLKSALAFNQDKPISESNKPSLHVLRRCRNTIYQLQNLAWKKAGSLGEYGSEEVDIKFLDFPRGVMSILSHSGGRPRIITPEQHKAKRREEVWRKEYDLMRPYHPNWRRN